MKQSLLPLIWFFALVFLLAYVLTSCNRSSYLLPAPKGQDSIIMPGCHFSAQSAFRLNDNFGHGLGFVTQYNACGQPTSLTTSIMLLWGDVDSVWYSFDYTGLNPFIRALKKHYAYFPSEDPAGAGALIYNGSNYPDETYGFEVILNNNIHAALQAGETEFLYEGNTLVSLKVEGALVSVRNDGKGNILGLSSGGDDIITYTYDYSQEATSQLYATSGYEISEEYNLMEMLGWIPVSPHHLRLEHAVALGKDEETGELYYAGVLEYDQHVINSEGKLVSFLLEDERTIVNSLVCY